MRGLNPVFHVYVLCKHESDLIMEQKKKQKLSMLRSTEKMNRKPKKSSIPNNSTKTLEIVSAGMDLGPRTTNGSQEEIQKIVPS